jgi:hypothetical protein
MKVWKNSRMETYYGGRDAFETDRCVVRIGDSKIQVSYASVVYEGTEIGEGHFRLKAQDGLGEASLHRFLEGRILDGWWKEEGEEGMWRIHLLD